MGEFSSVPLELDNIRNTIFVNRMVTNSISCQAHLVVVSEAYTCESPWVRKHAMGQKRSTIMVRRYHLVRNMSSMLYLP